MKPSQNIYSLGIDFGTESARTVLVDNVTAKIIATSVFQYDCGVIDRHLPHEGIPLPMNWALQNSFDWLYALERSVKSVLSQCEVKPESIIGIGVDFTSSTILPTTRDGTPLFQLERFRKEPHAWPKLWKHHAAQPQADRATKIAEQRSEKWLSRCGGRIDSEWIIPKALQML